MGRSKQVEDVLQKLLDSAPAAGLSAREVDTLREVIAAFRGWKILGRATRWFIVALTMLAGAAVAWDTLWSHVRGWFQG